MNKKAVIAFVIIIVIILCVVFLMSMSHSTQVPTNQVPVTQAPAIKADYISLCEDGTVYTILGGVAYKNGAALSYTHPVVSIGGLDKNNFICFLDDGSIYRNTELVPGNAMYGTVAPDGTAWIVNHDDAIFHSPINNIQWINVPGLLVNIHGTNSTTAVGVNKDGICFKTTDAGVTWSQYCGGAIYTVSCGNRVLVLRSDGVYDANCNLIMGGSFRHIAANSKKYALVAADGTVTMH